MEHPSNIKLDIFKECTTYNNDYCKFKPDTRHRHTWPQERIELPAKPPPEAEVKDLETLFKYHKSSYVPFNLFAYPRPILDTNPKATFTVTEEPQDEGKTEAIKSRPRLYMAPAISMDDIPDPEMRKLMCDYMYTTDWRKAAKEAARPVTKRVIPTTTFENVADCITLRTQQYHPLPAGCKEKGKGWDNLQTRALVNTTRTFWLNKVPEVKCGACTNPYQGLVKQEIKDEIAELVKKDALRLPHDVPVPGYAGYMPRLSRGVALPKTDLPSTHPFISQTEAVAQKFKVAK